MHCADLHELVLAETQMRMGHVHTRAGCRIELPLLEPSGDSVGVVVRKSGKGYVVDDGGHINGLLFQSTPGVPAASDRRVVQSLIQSSGLTQDPNSGAVFVETKADSIPYWAYELGRVVAVVASTIPSRRPRQRRPTRLGPRVQKAVTTRLVSDGVMGAIRPATNVRGVSQRTHKVDFSYTLPQSRLEPERTFFVLAVDLDIKDPMSRAHRSLITATDLGSVDPPPLVRVVYSTGSANGLAEPAVSLIKAAGDRSGLYENYSWDDTSEQHEFIVKVEQEVAPLVQTTSE